MNVLRLQKTRKRYLELKFLHFSSGKIAVDVNSLTTLNTLVMTDTSLRWTVGDVPGSVHAKELTV